MILFHPFSWRPYRRYIVNNALEFYTVYIYLYTIIHKGFPSLLFFIVGHAAMSTERGDDRLLLLITLHAPSCYRAKSRCTYSSSSAQWIHSVRSIFAVCVFFFLELVKETKYYMRIENAPNDDYAVVLLWLPS